MSVAAAADALFADHLVLDEARAAAWLPGGVADPDALAAQGMALMRALAVIEDGGPRGDEDANAEPALARLEAKVDLLAALVASLAAGMHPGDAPLPLRWSATGAELPRAAAPATTAIGDRGVLRVSPSLLLPTPLLLPASVAALDEGRMLLRFELPDEAFADALARNIFRIHRRDVARRRASTTP